MKKNINEIANELIGINFDEDFEENIIMTFGETEGRIIVSKDESNANIDYQVYEDKEDSLIICIHIESGIISDTWVA